MFQDFSAKTSPETGVARLASLRAVMENIGVDAFIVPRADAWQGEYVTESDARLAWLTGFTGSAGFCIATAHHAGVFVDGRYRVQVRAEVDPTAYTPVDWPETQPGPWLIDHLPKGAKVGFDPWLHTRRDIETLTHALAGHDITLVESANLVDAVWMDRPVLPAAPVRLHPIEFAGESSADKRHRIGAQLGQMGAVCAVLTLPDSISWLLNIRGRDVPRNPVVQSFALLHADGRVVVFADPAKFADDILAALGPDVSLTPLADFPETLTQLQGPVLVDPASAPLAVSRILDAAGIAMLTGADPCILPKARKNPAEIAGMDAAHLRDGVAVTEFLCWLDREGPKGGLTEIDVVTALEKFRSDTNALLDISFDTICGAGANGAIVHYRVTEKTNRPVVPGQILLVDSGAQYIDGTTDITRTVAIGAVPDDARAPFTRVLRGMIAIERARWPMGLAGRDLDALARAPLWEAGLDYDHGTGHGVGAALCVHEGPVRISRISELPLEPGMILSDEPGYYREGAFGIRLENLVIVTPAPDLPGADAQRKMLAFQNLTWVPFDTRLVDVSMLSTAERDWLNGYHADVLARLSPLLRPDTRDWARHACAPI